MARKQTRLAVITEVNVKWGNFSFWGERLIKGETLNHSNTWFAL